MNVGEQGLVERGFERAFRGFRNVEPAAVKVNLTIAVDNETEALWLPSVYSWTPCGLPSFDKGSLVSTSRLLHAVVHRGDGRGLGFRL